MCTIKIGNTLRVNFVVKPFQLRNLFYVNLLATIEMK